MTTEKFENGRVFIETLRHRFEGLIEPLQKEGTLTQDSLLRAFNAAAKEGRSRLVGDLTFNATYSGEFYQLVNITEAPVAFTTAEGPFSFHPRILLWTGKPSPAHTHPAHAGLKEREISCAYFIATPGASEIRFVLSDDITGTTKTVALLPPAQLGVDRHSSDLSTKFAHTFIPASTPLRGINVISTEGTELPVHTVTFNLYNSAKPSAPAPSTKVTDVKADLTARGIQSLQRATNLFEFSKLELKATDGDRFIATTEFAPVPHHELREVPTRDDKGWTALISSKTPHAACAGAGRG